MKAKDVMTTNVISVAPDATIAEVAAVMLERNISAVPVVGADGVMEGLVSEGDLIRRTELGSEIKRSWWLQFLTGEAERASDYVKTHGRHARDVMSTQVVTVDEETSLADIATILEERRIKRVPVVSGGRIVGIVSRSNLLQGLVARRGAIEAVVPANDNELRNQIMEVLAELSWLRPTQMNVIVDKGVVEIWGYVEVKAQRKALLVAVENVPGVNEIRDHTGVLPHFLAGA
jgi:CBS domain-containing protein